MTYSVNALAQATLPVAGIYPVVSSTLFLDETKLGGNQTASCNSGATFQINVIAGQGASSTLVCSFSAADESLVQMTVNLTYANSAQPNVPNFPLPIFGTQPLVAAPTSQVTYVDNDLTTNVGIASGGVSAGCPLCPVISVSPNVTLTNTQPYTVNIGTSTPLSYAYSVKNVSGGSWLNISPASGFGLTGTTSQCVGEPPQCGVPLVFTANPVGSGPFSAQITVRTPDANTPYEQTIIVSYGTGVPTVTTTTLPNGTVGGNYSQTLAATGGTPPYTWSIPAGAGALPPDLTLNPTTGTISGTVNASGFYPFGVMVTDSVGSTSPTQSLSITTSQITISGQITTLTMGDNCTNPGPPTTMFPEPGLVWLWYQLAGGQTGDTAAIQWLDPTGAVVATFQPWGGPAPAPYSGTYCWDLSLGAGAALGPWTVQLVTNNVVNFTLPFAVTPTVTTPVITSLTPSSATAGGPGFTLTVNGSSFASGATVDWNGSPLATTFASASQLTASVPASLIASPGTATITVVNPGNLTSNQISFSINAPTPIITSLSPSSATAGSAAFTLTVNGTGFLSGATIDWNATPLVTTFVNATQLTAVVAASLIVNPGSVAITVVNPGGVASGPFTFVVSTPTPIITSLVPGSATAGGSAFTLTVNGTGFLSGATIDWNGSPLTTSFVNGTQLTAAVAASLIAAQGPASITVVNPGNLASGAVTFLINLPATVTLSAAPSALTFSYQPGGVLPPGQKLSIFSSDGSVVKYSVASSDDWLAATPAGGQTPGVVTVSLQNSALPACPTPCSATITITPTGGGVTSTVQVKVTLTVIAAQPQLTVTPQFLTASFVKGSPTSQQFIQLANGGGGSLHYTVKATPDESSAWLNISCNGSGDIAASATQSVCVTLTPSAENVGLYHALLTVAADGGVTCLLPGATAAQPACTVNVTMQVSPNQPITLVSPSALQFDAVSGGATPASQVVSVFNTGTGQLNWTAQVHTASQTSWLQLSLNAGCAGGSDKVAGTSTNTGVSGAVPITVCVDPSRASMGTNYGAIDIINTATNALQPVTVLLNVLPSGETLPPRALPTGVVLVATAGQLSAPISAVLSNPNTIAIPCSATSITQDGAAWLGISAPSNIVDAQGTLPMTMQADATTLAPNIYHGVVTVGFGDSSAQGIDVVLIVNPSSSSGSETASRTSQQDGQKNAVARTSSTTCQSGQLVTQFKNVTSTGFQVTVGDVQQLYAELSCGSTPVAASDNDAMVFVFIQNAAGQPFPIIPQANSNACPTMTYGPVPQDVAAQIGQSNLWQCSWTPTSDEAGTVQLEVTGRIGAENAVVPALPQFLSGTVKLPAASLTPAPEPEGVSNAASPFVDGVQQANQVALGSYISIYGAYLSDNNPTNQQPVYDPVNGFPTTFLGTTVTLGNVPLPLYFATPNQINALVPATALQSYLNLTAPLTVDHDGATSLQNPQVSLTDVQPGIFLVSTNQYPQQGAILNALTGTLAAPPGVTSTSTPVHVGDYLEIYCNGLGPVHNPPPDGAEAGSNPLSKTVTTPQVFINNVPATVSYSGLAPGWVSLYQVNVQVPSVPPGSQIPLVIQMGTVPSNTATIAVQ
ncbi:MAG TPA: putative Ig domain-containing protein [Bryobacteraceae bacterium]|nr:putative Ig domain-containing protein [Bryobacteraceae bacterium]